MSDTKPNPILRLMPSLNDLAFLVPVLFLFTRMEGVRSMLGDCDTGWHIRTGEWILTNGRVPTKDIFSYTKPGAPWFAWEWLWDVGAAFLYHHGGLATVVLASILVLCCTFALLFQVLNRRTGNPLVAIGVTVLAAAGSTIHWLARPHLFTLLFLVIFLAMLERVREGHKKLLWLLPLLTILWTNLHGGFPAGILVIGAYAGGELVGAVLARSREERIAAARSSLPYIATAFGCLAASLVNPYFYHLHQHIWTYLHDAGETKNIVEFQGTNFQNGGSGYLEAMLVLGLGAAIWYAARKRFSETLLLAGWGHLALLVARNIPLFMIAAAPAVAGALTDWLAALELAPIAAWARRTAETAREISSEIIPLDRSWRIHALPALALLGVAVGMASPGAGLKLKPEFDEPTYPAHALASLAGANHIFTNDEWGDYLIYRLSPVGTKVFIDGRSDFYGGKFCQEYMDLVRVKYNWEQSLARYGVDAILLSPDAPLATAVKESPNWRVVYDDGEAIVFRSARIADGGDESTSTGNAGERVSDLRIAHSKTVVGGSRISKQRSPSL